MKKTNAKSLPFIPSSFYWRVTESDNTKKACAILNALTEEQIWAVKEFADSRYNDGYDDGYQPEEY